MKKKKQEIPDEKVIRIIHESEKVSVQPSANEHPDEDPFGKLNQYQVVSKCAEKGMSKEGTLRNASGRYSDEEFSRLKHDLYTPGTYAYQCYEEGIAMGEYLMRASLMSNVMYGDKDQDKSYKAIELMNRKDILRRELQKMYGDDGE